MGHFIGLFYYVKIRIAIHKRHANTNNLQQLPDDLSVFDMWYANA